VRANPVQFAVVREDPEIEAALVRAGGVQRALLIASGGCTALCLRSEFPRLDLTLLDANPAQLAHVRRKIAALASGAPPITFNVGSDDPRGLNAGGNFEGLFRGLRDFIREHILDAAEIEQRLADGAPWADVFGHRYWPVAFDLFFSDALLATMFGREATQHAPPGSYPAYFRGVFESGLARADASQNYFLHHVLLGRYEARALPRYLAEPPRSLDFEWREQPIAQLADPERYDLISLSNLFDWMSDVEVARVAGGLRARMKRGAKLVFRQLNHATNFQRHFAPDIAFDDGLAAHALASDRSLFYSRLNLGTKV
jgi:S-adenosylmethionine-diacylglycerol 3-amino-3-carboxypropyl transferase